MSVGPEITRAVMREELALIKDIARTYKWGVIPNFASLTIMTTMYSYTGDLYIVEMTLDDYKELPPFIEFIDPETGEKGTRHAYPKSTDSFFHDSGPCICAPFSRKAYKSVTNKTGPHEDWHLGDWKTSKAQNYDWSNASNIGGILLMIQSYIFRSDVYKGRMA